MGKSSHPLRVARFLRNLTMVQLAEEARVGATTVWRAEHRYAISAESRRRLCSYFGMTSQELDLLPDAEPEKSSAQVSGMEYALEQSRAVSDIAAEQPLRVHSHADGAAPAPEWSVGVQEQSGAWLAQASNQIASLLDANWKIEAILDSLRVVLQVSQAMPVGLRESFLRSSVSMGGVASASSKRGSQEERVQLEEALQKSITQSWQFFHLSSPTQVLVIGRALLSQLQQTQGLLLPDVSARFYAQVYNLVGSALFYQGFYDRARQTHEKAYKSALEGSDHWNQVQSLNWLAIVASMRGQYVEAIQYIETGFHVLDGADESEHRRLKAHLLADWAYNASILGERSVVQEKLAESALFLQDLDLDEEFDQVRWHQLAGDCMLMN